MEHGYIKLWRKIIQTSFFKHPKIFQLACYLLIESNHKDREILFNGEEITIKRGQCLVGLKVLAASLGQSIQNVRTGLSTLSTIGFLTIKSTNRFSIVSIDKYEHYQGEINTEDNKPLTNKQQTTNKPLTTLNNDKNDKNDKNTSISAPAEASIPVNWDNCKTDIQRLLAHYVRLEMPELYANATQAQATGLFKRYGRPASEILAVAGDIDTAKRAFDTGRALFNKKGLSWNLSTISKNIAEFVNSSIGGQHNGSR